MGTGSAGESRRDQRPWLVIVSGAPGSGKSTLACRLGTALGLPVLLRDELKETLYDTLGAPDRAESARLGQASYALLAVVAGRLLEAGVGMVLESNFRRGLSETDLASLLTSARAALVHCEGEPETIVRRYRERAERGERHPGHHDSESFQRLRDELAAGLFEPLDLGVPTLRVDTTTEQEYTPEFEEIVAFLRAASL
jgi:predicted kinase